MWCGLAATSPCDSASWVARLASACSSVARSSCITSSRAICRKVVGGRREGQGRHLEVVEARPSVVCGWDAARMLVSGKLGGPKPPTNWLAARQPAQYPPAPQGVHELAPATIRQRTMLSTAFSHARAFFPISSSLPLLISNARLRPATSFCTGSAKEQATGSSSHP